MVLDRKQLLQRVDSDGEEAKLVLLKVALRMTQHQAIQEEFTLLGRRYSIASYPNKQEILIRLLDPGGKVAWVIGGLYGLLMTGLA